MTSKHRQLIALSVLVALLMVVGAVSFGRYARRHAPDPQLVAVAPFDVFVPGLEEWRVRLAEALTAELAGVPQTVVRERWRGSSRPEIAALELARRTSAGRAIYGRLDPVAGRSDSVRVQMILVDARSGRVLLLADRRWPVEGLRALAAALAHEIRERHE